MELWYRLLGLTSGISQRLSRMRINFVPINLAMGCVVTAIAFFTFAMVMEASSNNRKPIKSTIADVKAGRNKQSYVTLSGEIIPKLALEEVMTRKGSSDGRTTARFTLLIDKETEQGIFVETGPEESLGDNPHAYTTTGMVAAPDSKLAAELQTISAESEGRIDSVHLLKQGAAPAELTSSLVFFALSGLGTLLFWVSYAKKYVIFRPERALVGAPAGIPVAMGDTFVRGTGEFTLDTGDRQRFLGMPCASVELETGDVGFICNVDASSSFMGVTTTKRDGLWIMAVRRDGTVRFERGRQYLGLGSDPALKIDFTDALSGGHRSGILSFESEAARDSMVTYLTSRGTPVPPAPYGSAAVSSAPPVPYGSPVPPEPSTGGSNVPPQPSPGGPWDI